MIDINQLLLAIVVFALSGIFVAVGIQFYLILKELRESVRKMNKVLDDTGVISESVSKPVNMLSGVVMGIKGGSGIAKMIKS